MIEKLFKQIGLGKREVKVYLACLDNANTTISILQEKTKLSRSTVYYVLDVLIKNNLISESKNANRKYYQAEDLKNLKNLLEERKRDLDASINQYDEIEKILNLKIKDNTTFQTSYYQGIEAVSKLYNNIYKNNKNTTFRIFSSLQNPKNPKIRKLFSLVINNRLKNNIKLKAISPAEDRKLELRSEDTIQLRESRFLPQNKFPLKSDLVICDNLLHMTSFENDEPVTVLI